MDHPMILALLGTGFSFLGTALGSALVFFVRGELNVSAHKAFLGFASGVMIAASVWSLLIPAMDMAVEYDMAPWIPAAGGFIAGGLFLFLLDKLLPHMHVGADHPEGPRTSWHRTTMLVFAVTLHNIPEGMAVGLSFALAAQEDSKTTMAAAIALALGMALQNFPEGATISLPLRKEGVSRTRAFVYGALSGVVEPVAGVVGVVLALSVAKIMPFMLAFAAGAMIYVVLEELVPSANATDEGAHVGTMSAMFGFLLMMVLDLAIK